MNKKYRELLQTTLISLVIMICLLLRTDRLTYSHPDFEKDWDHHSYIEMANKDPFSFQLAPFAWRVLNPLLAKLMPFELSTNFTILSFTALWFTAIIIYFILRKIGFSSTLSTIGQLFFFSLGWATKYNLFDFWLTDPLGFLFIASVMWSILAKNDLLFALLLAIGLTAKENVLFAAPLYFTLDAKKIVDFRTLFRFVILVSPAIIILITTRICIPITNGEYYNAINLIYVIGTERIQNFSADTLMEYSIGTFGVSLIFLPLFALRENFSWFKKFLPFVLLTYSSLLFAVNTSRLLVSAFPAVIIMSLHGIKNICNKTSFDEKYFGFLPLFIITLLFIKKDWLVIRSIYETLALMLLLAFSLQLDWFNQKKHVP